MELHSLARPSLTSCCACPASDQCLSTALGFGSPALKPHGTEGEGWPRGARPLPQPGPLPAPQKLQLVLAPLHSLASRALERGLPDPGSLLVHSFQQLDRIDSLSEQISFLEEQLGSCECSPPPSRTPTGLPGGWGQSVPNEARGWGRAATG